VRRVDHLDSIHSTPDWHVKAPQFGKLLCTIRVNCHAAGKLIWNRSNFSATLHPGVTAYRHQSALLASDEAARKRKVHYCAHVGDPVAMLRDAHRPHEHRRFASPIMVANFSISSRVEPDAASSSSQE